MYILNVSVKSTWLWYFQHVIKNNEFFVKMSTDYNSSISVGNNMFSSSQFVSAFHGEQKENMLYIVNLLLKRGLVWIWLKGLNRTNIQSINKRKTKTKVLAHFLLIYIHSSCKNGTNFRRLELRYTELYSLGILKIYVLFWV